MMWSASVWTFYAPSFWDGRSYEELIEYSASSPRAYWDQLLDAISHTGASAVEFATPPSEWTSAIAAYGSQQGVVQALQTRELKLSSSYFGGAAVLRAVLEPESLASLKASVAEHASFLAASGSELLLVGGPPHPPEPMGNYLQSVAAVLNQLGDATRSVGVRLAVHTEAYSSVAQNADVDAVMSFSDPSVVHLCPDPGHITLDGGNAAEMVRRHIDRIPIVHWKDSARSLPAEPNLDPDTAEERMSENFCKVGDGLTDWSDLAGVLRTADFRGWSVAELDMADDPVSTTREIINSAERYLNQQSP